MSARSYVSAIRLTILLLALVLARDENRCWAGDAPGLGDERETLPVPKDTCILELNLPRDAQVTVNDRDEGARREIAFHHLQPDLWNEVALTVRFGSGWGEKRRLLLRAGKRLRLALQDPAIIRPELVLQTGHSNDVSAVAFSPDGRYAATSGSEIILWDVASAQKIRSIVGSADSLAFSPDGCRLLAVRTGDEYGRGGEALSYDIATGRRICTFRRRDYVLQQGMFSADGRSVLTLHTRKEKAAGGNSRTGSPLVVVWDAVRGRAIRTQEVAARAEHFALSPDGRILLSRSESRPTTLWDVQSGVKTATLEDPPHWNGSHVFSADSRLVATASFSGKEGAPEKVVVSEAGTGKKRCAFELDNGSWKLGFRPDGEILLACCDYPNSTAVLWNTRTGARIRTFDTAPNSEGARCLAFSADGKRIITGADDHCARVWDAETGREVRVLEGRGNDIREVLFSPNGRFFVSQVFYAVRGTGLAVARDAATATTISIFFPDPSHLQRYLSGIDFSPDSRYVLSGSVNGAVLWEAATGKQVRTFARTDDSVRSMSEDRGCTFSPDGRRAWTEGCDGGPMIWDVLTGKGEKIAIEGDKNDNSWLASSPRTWQVLVANQGGAVLFDLDKKRAVARFAGVTGKLKWGAFDPETRHVLLVSDKDAALFRNRDRQAGANVRETQGRRCFQPRRAPGPLDQRRGRRDPLADLDRQALADGQPRCLFRCLQSERRTHID